MNSKKWLGLFFSCLALQSIAQTRIDFSVVKPAEWVLQKTDSVDYAIDNYDGKVAFFLKRSKGDIRSASLAYPKGLDFKDGIIELDIASPNGKDGLVGLAFRIQDGQHYETLFFRPDASGTVKAIQYMPEKKTEFNWWDYEADKYQAKAALPLTDWFHIKVVVRDRTMTVFLNKQPLAVMIRHDLDPELVSGSVGFWLGNCTSGAYRDLKIVKFNP